MLYLLIYLIIGCLICGAYMQAAMMVLIIRSNDFSEHCQEDQRYLLIMALIASLFGVAICWIWPIILVLIIYGIIQEKA